MKLFNVRQGFATNSSSSHSILVLPDNVGSIGDDEDSDFNWNFFTASSVESKANYLAKTIEISLRDMGWKNKEVNKFLVEFFENKDIVKNITNVSIDHQSVITLPRNWDGTDINKDFIKELKNYFEKETTVIVGGNDNTEENHKLYDIDKISDVGALPKESSNDYLVARKDDSHWVVFNGEVVPIYKHKKLNF